MLCTGRSQEQAGHFSDKFGAVHVGTVRFSSSRLHQEIDRLLGVIPGTSNLDAFL